VRDGLTFSELIGEDSEFHSSRLGTGTLQSSVFQSESMPSPRKLGEGTATHPNGRFRKKLNDERPSCCY
jgi:hypothetical protein